MSSFHLAAILNFAVSWCETWNPLLGKHYMVVHHIVVQHKLIEHCAQRFVSNTHFSKLLLSVLFSPLVS